MTIEIKKYLLHREIIGKSLKSVAFLVHITSELFATIFK